ncbi:MAG: 50S ribosomal protein L24 [Patescibacteria group bacterium]
MKIKTGDNVRVMTGAAKGKTGKVTQVFPVENRVIVEGLNVRTRHLKGRGDKPGQKIEYAAPMHASNVQLVGKGGKVGRVGYKFLNKDGKQVKVRVLKTGKKTEDIE